MFYRGQWQIMHDILNLPELKFPAGILWGSSTSAYQIEGDCTNSDWDRGAREGRWKASLIRTPPRTMWTCAGGWSPPGEIVRKHLSHGKKSGG